MTLDDADRVMMAQSSNTATYAVEQRYGRATLNAFAPSIGATSTELNHTFGCGTPANDTTLEDLARMIEGASDGSLLPTASVRNRFFDTLVQQSGVPDGMEELVAEEAARVGKSAIVDEFVANIVRRGKGGSLSDVRAAFGRMLIPFKSGGVIVQRRVLLRALLQLRGLPGRRSRERRLRQGGDREVPVRDPLGDRDLASEPSAPLDVGCPLSPTGP